MIEIDSDLAYLNADIERQGLECNARLRQNRLNSDMFLGMMELSVTPRPQEWITGMDLLARWNTTEEWLRSFVLEKGLPLWCSDPSEKDYLWGRDPWMKLEQERLPLTNQVFYKRDVTFFERACLPHGTRDTGSAYWQGRSDLLERWSAENVKKPVDQWRLDELPQREGLSESYLLWHVRIMSRSWSRLPIPWPFSGWLFDTDDVQEFERDHGELFNFKPHALARLHARDMACRLLDEWRNDRRIDVARSLKSDPRWSQYSEEKLSEWISDLFPLQQPGAPRGPRDTDRIRKIPPALLPK